MAVTNVNRVNSGTSGRGVGSETTASTPLHNKRIQAGLSTQIVVQVTDGGTSGNDANKYVIGAIQQLQVTETRDVVEVYELGTDAIIQLVPRTATTYSLDIDRIVFDFQRLPQALQREYRHIHAQRRPFDIVITDYNPYLNNTTGPQEPDSGKYDAVTNQSTAVNTTFGNCWFTRLNFSYRANEYLITESCNLKCEYVIDSTEPNTIKGQADVLERDSGISPNASVMSAFDATRSAT